MAINFQVTDGVNRYTGLKNWGKVPAGTPFDRLSQLAVDHQGRVVLVQRNEPAVLIFGTDGQLESSWHHPQLESVHGVFVAQDGHIFIATYDAQQILKFTPEGELVLEIGSFNQPNWRDPFNAPTDVTVADDGEIYVADGYANARVHRFAADGTHIQSWGEQGTGPGEFNVPHGVWVTRDNRVLVLDRDNDRIQVFTRDGQLLDIWAGLTRPMDIWADDQDNIFVSDQTPRILRLAPDGKVVGIFRGLARAPHGLYGDHLGNLFVADQVPMMVTKYEKIG